MGMFLKHRHFVGAYKNGRHINGYFYNNHKLFHYKTNLYIKYVDVLNNKTVANTKTKLDWNKWYTFNTLPIKLPAGWSDQPKYFLPNQSGNLGLQSISYDITRIYMVWNITPITGLVTINYKNSNGNILKTVQAKGNLNDPFNLNNYNNMIPKNYTIDHIISGNNITTYPSYEVNATVNVQLKYQPDQGTITINFINNGSNIKQMTVKNNVGTQFNINSYLNNIPSGYVYAETQGNTNEFTEQAQTVNIGVIKGNSSSNNNPSGNQGIITINYVDENNNIISSTKSQGIPGTIFDIQPYEISVPNGYIYNETLNESGISTYPYGTATIEIQVIPQVYVPPTTVQPVPVMPTPSNPPSPTAPVYRVFIDEDTDKSENPSTFNYIDSHPKLEKATHPVGNNIYADKSATTISLNNITYSSLGLNSNSMILGPNDYADPYLDNMSFVNLYFYRVDTSKPLSTQTLGDGSLIVFVKCKPAFVKGVTFQYAIPSKSGGMSKHIVDAPSKNVSTPDKWKVGKDPYTNSQYYIVPYNTKITEQDLTKQLLNGKKDKFYAHSNKYELENNRTINIQEPYDYLLYCKG